MRPKTRRNIPGTFVTRNLREGAWRLSRTEPGPIDVFVRGADTTGAEPLEMHSVRDVGIEWGAETAALTATSAGRTRTVQARSAIVHEPLPHLYEALPLAILDSRARRFWRTVFRVVRIPGGRLLLGVLARRS
jgi:hypothetical protein